MHIQRVGIVLHFISLTWASCLALSKNETGQPCVRTGNAIIYGTFDTSMLDVHQFLGIPYAEPPLGELRFAPPKAKCRFDGPVNATKTPPSCMQYLTNNASVYTREVLEWNLGGLDHTSSHINEDCLTLSIWTPAPQPERELLPVLIFLHGGGFRWGGQDQPYNNPAQWVQQSQRHLVVIPNYRLNIFGFPNAAGLENGKRNVGLLDQRLAIEWVRNNIEDFGGDPSRLVLWGQSAGAIAAGYYAFSYHDDPIVSAFIMDSGTEIVDRTTTDPAHSYFSWVASQVGCGKLSARQELDCMRTVDAKVVEDVIQTQQDAGKAPEITFQPIVDEVTVFSDWAWQTARGSLAKVPVIIGTNVDDGVPFAPYDPNGVNKTLAHNQTLEYFFCPAWKSSTMRIAQGVRVYRFLYSGNFTNISPRPWLGSWHSTELPLIFGTHSNYRGNSTLLEYETSFMMQDSWISFAENASDPRLGRERWPPFQDPRSGMVAAFGSAVVVGMENVRDIELQCSDTFRP